MSPGRRTTNRERDEQVEYVSAELPSQVALLTRLLAREALHGELTQTEVGVLRTLERGPLRITELAELEGLAQPTTTLLVKRLEKAGLTRRERQREDQRVVLVSLTDAGETALDDVRERAHATLHKFLEEMSDSQVGALVVATETLQELIAVLIGGVLGARARTAA